MDAFEFLKLFGSIQDGHILSAHAPASPKAPPRKRLLLIAAVIGLLILAGCALAVLMGLKGARQDKDTYDVTRPGDAIESSETIPDPKESEAQLAAYRDALQTLYTSYVLPGDYDVGYDGISDLSTNKFAIYDIDGDGYQELILAYTTTYNAGHTFGIYDYGGDAWDLWEELREYPLITLWTNGNLTAGASHAHGLGCGEILWPYTLYRYDPASDTYEQVARVDTWEREYYPQDYSGNPFPDDLDLDGDGVVYLLSFSETEDPQILDGDAFWAWDANYRTTETVLPWVSLTPQNIEALAETDTQ